MKAILLILLLFPLFTYSQDQNEQLDAVISDISYGKDTLRSVFDWVANNISYDVSLLRSDRRYSSEKEIVEEAIERRQGVCQHYASLFNAIVQQLGYESYVVSGYTRQNNEINDELSHAWNAVKVQGHWYLFDPTWSSGYVDQEQFLKKYDSIWYRVPPNEFIRTHIPFDPIWQLSNAPLTHQAIQRDIFNAIDTSKFNFTDSIAHYLAESDLDKLRSSARRIRSFGITDFLIETRLTGLHQQVQMMLYNQQAAILNRGAAILNTTIADYNQYITAKNRRFKRPKLPDDELRTISVSLNTNIDTAYAIFNTVVATDPSLTKSLNENRSVAENVMHNIRRETGFLERYLNTWKIFRAFAFR